MIISQTPVRISFLGGGTDYPDYYREHGGATLAVSINKYNLVTVHPLTRFSDHALRVHYSQVETVRHLDEIQHPSARECLRFMGIESGIEIHYVADLPARTGLGSSSSATVGLLHALHAFKGEMVSREQLAAEAVHVEQNMVGERVGSQDQYACAMGGLRHYEFGAGGVRVNSVVLNASRLTALQDKLILLYTGIQRHAHEVLDEQLQRTSTGANTADLGQLKALVDQGINAICQQQNLRLFGELLHEGWQLKRRLSSKISTDWIDQVYARALTAGAVGGKLLGAGSGGFLLLYVEPEDQPAVCAALPELRRCEFAFEDLGTQLIFYRP